MAAASRPKPEKTRKGRGVLRAGASFSIFGRRAVSRADEEDLSRRFPEPLLHSVSMLCISSSVSFLGLATTLRAYYAYWTQSCDGSPPRGRSSSILQFRLEPAPRGGARLLGYLIDTFTAFAATPLMVSTIGTFPAPARLCGIGPIST